MSRFVFSFALFVLIGCSKKSEPQPSTEPPASTEARPSTEAPPSTESPAVQEARTTFKTLCVTCHGESGKGDGIAAANLNPKPRNYTDKAWQASVTDDQIRTIIINGGAAVGKSPVMPASPQFKDKPEVVDELVRIVRSFGK